MRKIGRPHSDNPKEERITIRLDRDSVKLLDYCCERTQKTKSQVLRKGLELYYKQNKGELNGE